MTRRPDGPSSPRPQPPAVSPRPPQQHRPEQHRPAPARPEPARPAPPSQPSRRPDAFRPTPQLPPRTGDSPWNRPNHDGNHDRDRDHNRPQPPVTVRPQPPVHRPQPPVTVRPQPPVHRPQPPVTVRPQPPVHRPQPPVTVRPQPPHVYNPRPQPPSVYHPRPQPPHVYHPPRPRPTVIINQTRIYAPHYHNQRIGNTSWGGAFFAGYMAGRVDQARWDAYYNDYRRAPLYRPYALPVTVWQPYYRTILIEPLPILRPVYAPPVYVNYATPMAWQTPPLDPRFDPLEQLANYGQLTKPGYWGPERIGAIEARDRLNQGAPLTVGGVTVYSYQDLARVVPEMAYGQRPGILTPEQCGQLVQTMSMAQSTGSGYDQGDVIANLPSFEKVYSPKALVAEDDLDGQRINRTMDAAEAIYARPDVKAAIAAWWQANPNADRDALNRQINTTVTSALVSDLQANRARYAANPELDENPVDYLRDPQSAPDAWGYNLAAIDRVVANAPGQLQTNLICAANQY